jgi:hypothetical protein
MTAALCCREDAIITKYSGFTNSGLKISWFFLCINECSTSYLCMDLWKQCPLMMGTQSNCLNFYRPSRQIQGQL